MPADLFTLNHLYQGLTHVLKPDANGVIPFGIRGEPLRLSQIEALKAVLGFAAAGKSRGYIVQPGGSGKTREGIALARAMHRQNKKTLFVVPSQQAVIDFAKEARALFPDMNIGEFYTKKKKIGDLTFITYKSLLTHSTESEEARINPADFSLVLWDEAHSYLTELAGGVIDRFDHAINIGLTATPKYYEGKEVANVLPEKIYELDLPTAIDRNEISDFTNFVINTKIETHLDQSNPDAEEGAAASLALNTDNRNRIFAEIYRDTIAKLPDGTEMPVFGEQAIVFCAGINHAHALAKQFNDLMKEQIEKNPNVRHALRAKGLNPDEIEHVAVAFHVGDTEQHLEKDVKERQRILEAYKEGKILVLVSTSALQQSFDSPKTSVVIDTIPRRTYVGVGQAGMRALRTFAGNERFPAKEMALIFNTVDADTETLTFSDYQNMPEPKKPRANLELRTGVRVSARQTDFDVLEAAEEKRTRKPRAKPDPNYNPAVKFEVTTRTATGLSEAPIADNVTGPTLNTDRIKELLGLIVASGNVRNSAEINDFLIAAQPWAESIAQKRAVSLFPDFQKVHPQIIQTAVDETHLIALRTFLTTVEELAQSQPDTPIAYHEIYSAAFRRHIGRQLREAEHEAFEPAVTMPEQEWKHIPAQDCDEERWVERADAQTVAKLFDNPKRFSARERQVVHLRLNGATLEETGNALEPQVTKERIRQIEARAHRKARANLRETDSPDWHR